jgi:beta-galactosidase
MINMPWMTYWANSNYIWSGKQIKQLGLNLNAPGDRTSEQNTLWLEFPYIAGADPEIPVEMDTIDIYKIRKDPISITSKNTPWVSASSIVGLRSLEISLSEEATVPEASYSINLYFCEPEQMQKGERIFDVIIQDSKVLENFDIISETGQDDKELVKSFSGIRAGKTLSLEMVPIQGNTILSGIELIQESIPEI